MSISYSSIEVMVMTDRDFRILKLLTELRYMTTKQIREVVFPNLNPSVCYRRLNYLTDNKLIFRRYYNLGGNSNSYIYYLDKAPAKKSVKHELLVTEFVVKLVKLGHELLEVDKTPIYKGFIPDAIIKFKKADGSIRHLFLEVQLSRYSIYEKYYNINPTGRADIPNILYVVTDKPQKPIQIRNLRIVIDDLEMHKLSFYFS